MALKTHRPSGKIPPPVILLEGDEGSGKSWVTAELSASPKVGRTLWLELGKETTAEQYGAIPGVRYEILDPDNDTGVWDWHAIIRAVRDARDEAQRARDAGEPPTVLVIDQVGAIWDLLSEWADNRARASKKIAEALEEDPNAEYNIGHALWNAAADRWHKLLTAVLKFPGIAILLSRGQEVTLFENGQPTKRKTWKVEGQRGLTFDMPIWVRMTRDSNPKLIKFRSVHNGIRADVDRARMLPGFTLEKLIFEVLEWDPATSGHRAIVPMVAGSDAPMSEYALVLETAIETAEGVDQLTRAYNRIKPARDEQQISEAEATRLSQYARKRKADMQASAGTQDDGGRVNGRHLEAVST